jgi:peptidoglycan/LPS O-acetylase OafA/YrhL
VTASTPEAERVTTIDGLRGVAAMLVVLFHLHGAVSRTATDWLWAPLDWIVRNGFLGVDIFFVISGFVIALSVSKGAPTFSYFGRFIVRRSIRLDPPYWTSMVLEIVLIWVSLRLYTGMVATLPSVPQVLSHLIYAQELLGYGSIVPNFWTLCYEIQFYGFYVGVVVVAAKLPNRLSGPTWFAIGAGGVYLLSLYARFWRSDWLLHGLAIDRWFQFYIGVLTWRAVTRANQLTPLILACGALLTLIIVTRAPAIQILPVITAAWLVAAARDPRWGRLFATRPIRFLGLISYSIYLYHASVGWRFVSLIQRFLPGPWEPLTAISVFLVSIVVSVAFSAAFWWLIERPCLAFCHRVKLPRRVSTPVEAALERPAVV